MSMVLGILKTVKTVKTVKTEADTIVTEADTDADTIRLNFACL